ncbi:hypothetical protein TELCIR_04349 [Teladorsagia circumcincta]|uniref:Uncharacterized protein n=1 Tax=Teladorsagia circumcincta TaxID=45464 RepID=A0A2G9UU40_TELCI|nr:hypothetical protein TELCIR_04349 [Teladorsagia circumcincta]
MLDFERPATDAVSAEIPGVCSKGYWHDTWGVGGRLGNTLWGHSSTVGSRTTVHAEWASHKRSNSITQRNGDSGTDTSPELRLPLPNQLSYRRGI